MMRRLLGLAVVVALAGAITAAPRAAAGVDGDVDGFAAALEDLAQGAQEASAVLSERSTGGAHAAELGIVLGDLRTTVARVAAAGLPLADHLATGRVSPEHAADTLEKPVRSLGAAVQQMVGASLRSPQHSGEGVTTAQQPSPVELLAPAIQALARTFEALGPALEALRPAVEPLAPVIGPACGQLPGVVFLALGLVPVLVPVPLPSLPVSPTVLAGTLLAPAFLLCASLPMPAQETPADGSPGDGATADGPYLGAAEAPPAPSAPPMRQTGRGSVSSDPPRSPTLRPTPGTERTPGRQTEEAAAPSSSARTTGAQPRLVTGVPLLPVDHDGEATGIALLVLAAAAVTAAVTVQARRRRGLTDWAIPAATGTGVGALAAGAMAWNGAAEQVAPWAQIPYVISGGMTAFVLGVVSITLAVAGPLARIAATER